MRLFPYSPIFRLTSTSSSKIWRASASRPSFRSSTARERVSVQNPLHPVQSPEEIDRCRPGLSHFLKSISQTLPGIRRDDGIESFGQPAQCPWQPQRRWQARPGSPRSEWPLPQKRHSCSRCNEPPGEVSSDRGSSPSPFFHSIVLNRIMTTHVCRELTLIRLILRSTFTSP